MSGPPRRPPEALWDRVELGAADDCWPWLGAVNQVTGYGHTSTRAWRNVSAHRAAWELTFGPIPQHLQVDHLCRNPICCNPRHMQLLTAQVHGRRSSEQFHGHLGNDAICRYGHIGDRYRKRNGELSCRECNRIATRKWAEQKRGRV